jgi:hypothetical protein
MGTWTTQTGWKKLVAVAALLLVLGFLWHRWWNPEFQLVTATDSPDGRYRHLTEVKSPPGFFDSPVMYRFGTIDRRTNQVVPGTEWERSGDSCRYPDWEKPHVWTPKELAELDAKTGGAPTTRAGSRPAEQAHR